MSKQETSSVIESLVHQLASTDMAERVTAREALVELGGAVVPAVTALAHSQDDHARWECAKTLAQIADPSSIGTLIQLLEDSEDGTRWDAGLGLIAIGRPAVTPVLRAIIHRSTDYAIIPGARHVMHEFCKAEWGGFLKPVYTALSSHQARESGPVAAAQALKDWEYSDLTK
jgi:hypothetical protein